MQHAETESAPVTIPVLPFPSSSTSPLPMPSPALSAARGLWPGERCELPQRVWAEPGHQFLVHFALKAHRLVKMASKNFATVRHATTIKYFSEFRGEDDVGLK